MSSDSYQTTICCMAQTTIHVTYCKFSTCIYLGGILFWCRLPLQSRLDRPQCRKGACLPCLPQDQTGLPKRYTSAVVVSHLVLVSPTGASGPPSWYPTKPGHLRTGTSLSRYICEPVHLRVGTPQRRYASPSVRLTVGTPQSGYASVSVRLRVRTSQSRYASEAS